MYYFFNKNKQSAHKQVIKDQKMIRRIGIGGR